MGIEKIATKADVFAKSFAKVNKKTSLKDIKIFDKLVSKKPKISKLPEPKSRVEYKWRRAGKLTLEKEKLKQSPGYAIKELKELMLKKANKALSENFEIKKQNLIRELAKVCDKNLLIKIEKADSPEKLAKILVEQDIDFMEKYVSTVLDKMSIESAIMGKLPAKSTLDMEQFVYKLMKKRIDFIHARERAMHVQSTNPQVIAIENILKEQYGVKFVSLKNNEELAKNVLKAYETAVKNGVQVPKNVIATDFLPASGEHLLGEGTILLNPAEQSLKEGFTSTGVDFHTTLHEIMHGTHPALMSFSHKKIPTHLKHVKNQLSGYSAISLTHETFTELNTKRIVQGLNKEEQELFDYLNIFATN